MVNLLIGIVQISCICECIGFLKINGQKLPNPGIEPRSARLLIRPPTRWTGRAPTRISRLHTVLDPAGLVVPLKGAEVKPRRYLSLSPILRKGSTQPVRLRRPKGEASRPSEEVRDRGTRYE